MSCRYCGGTVLGDGYTSPIACENVVVPDGACAGSGPYWCGGASTGPEVPRGAGGFPALGGGGRGVGADESPSAFVMHPVTLAMRPRGEWEKECRAALGVAEAEPRKRGLDASKEFVLLPPSPPRFPRELVERLAPRPLPFQMGLRLV